MYAYTACAFFLRKMAKNIELFCKYLILEDEISIA